MRSISSRGVRGRPTGRARLFQRQYQRKPRRCQAMTVSGFTTRNASRHRGQSRESRTQQRRSAGWSWTRRGPSRRCRTKTWWRSARSSASRSERRRKRSRTAVNRTTRTLIIRSLWRSQTQRKIPFQFNTYGIFGRHEPGVTGWLPETPAGGGRSPIGGADAQGSYGYAPPRVSGASGARLVGRVSALAPGPPRRTVGPRARGPEDPRTAVPTGAAAPGCAPTCRPCVHPGDLPAPHVRSPRAASPVSRANRKRNLGGGCRPIRPIGMHRVTACRLGCPCRPFMKDITPSTPGTGSHQTTGDPPPWPRDEGDKRVPR